MSAGTREALDHRLEAYQRETGHQVIVWIGTSIGGEALEPWAVKTFEAWGIGRKGQDDGVAIFILTQDRKVKIEVGYGLEGQLTDLVSGRIIREELAPRMRAGDGDGAVTAAVAGVLRALGGEHGAAPEVAPQGRPLSKWQLVGMAIGGVLLLLFLITHPRAAMWMLFTLASSGRRGGGWSGGSGGFSGGGGRSGGGGASGSW